MKPNLELVEQTPNHDLAETLSSLLTIAGSRVFDLQGASQGAGSLPHGTLAGVGVVVTGTDWLSRAPLSTAPLTDGADRKSVV